MNIRQDILKLRERHIRWALERTHGNLRQSALSLGMDPTTLARWMRELDKQLKPSPDLTAYAAGLRKERTWWLA